MIFEKLPKILTLLLKLHTQKNDLQLFACASHNFWPRIKNPWCYENLQVISTRLYQLIWILLFYGAIFKTNKMKQNFEKKNITKTVILQISLLNKILPIYGCMKATEMCNTAIEPDFCDK